MDKKTSETPENSLSHLFDIVSFKKDNFVQSWINTGEKYDTILCLSVTKWIHLNWGHEGLITLFGKVWRLLQPGGVFILEPQPWKSYVSNRQVSEVLPGKWVHVGMAQGQKGHINMSHRTLFSNVGPINGELPKSL